MEITKEYIEKNLEKTQLAVNSVEVLENGEKLFDMIERYVSDAAYFLEKENLVSALGAVEYAHGLLDAGVYMKLFKIRKNEGLFVFGTV